MSRWGNVIENIKEAAADTVGELKESASELADQATAKANELAEQATSKADRIRLKDTEVNVIEAAVKFVATGEGKAELETAVKALIEED